MFILSLFWITSLITRRTIIRSKIAIKMSRNSEKGKGAEEVKSGLATLEEFDFSDEEDEMDDEAEDEVREETPDLYRNSSLGM